MGFPCSRPLLPVRFINLKDKAGHLDVQSDGTIYSGDDIVAKLSVVEFSEPKALRKQGSGLFENKLPTNVVSRATRAQVKQGMLETSNVNPVEEMVNLIKNNRLFEHDLKAMKTYNDLLGREVNDIGKL